MKMDVCGEVVLSDLEPTAENFEAEFLGGLKKNPKKVPCKFFYDENGSKLFDQICELEEYYLTRTETKILRENIGEIIGLCGEDCFLVELGSGQSSKTRLLLDHLISAVAYTPIDISRAHLIRAAERLNGDYYPLEVLPVCADYNKPLRLPAPERSAKKKVIFFPDQPLGILNRKRRWIF